MIAAPVVEIDVGGLDGADDVAGSVLERALEAGFTLSPDAPHRIELRTTEAGIEVALRTADVRWTQRVVTADRAPEIVRLEVAQHVVALVQAHVDESSNPEGAVRIVTDSIDAGEHQALLLAFVAEGVPVTADPSAERVACFGSDGSAARLAFGNDEVSCAAALETISWAPGVHEGVTAALKREQDAAWEAQWPASDPADATEDVTDPEVREEAPPAPLPLVDGTEAPPRPPTHRWGPLEGLLVFDGGIAVRPRIAGRFGGAVVVGRRLGPVGSLEVASVPSRGELEFRVLDTNIGGGVGWRWAIGARGRISVSGLAGVRLHSFGFPGQPMSTAADVSVAAPVRLEWRPVQRLSLGARVAPAFDGRSRRHVVGEQDIWQRGPWRVDVGLSIGIILGGR